ncbi:MAG: recombination protein RecR [Planctomycetes bacterium]|nr:recombination protein RecR [Planctomycetota bacterium]
MKPPNILSDLIEHLGKLPGLGEKSAERIAFYLLKAPKELTQSLCSSIAGIKGIKYCPKCFNFAADNGSCSICDNLYRDKSVICVVEEISDLWVLEQTGAYKGLYHVLGGRIAPLENTGPDNLTIRQLLDKIRNGNGIREVILATNHTFEGDATAAYIQDKLGGGKVKISRLARGIPSGNKLETVSRLILTDALRDRKTFNSRNS